MNERNIKVHRLFCNISITETEMVHCTVINKFNILLKLQLLFIGICMIVACMCSSCSYPPTSQGNLPFSVYSWKLCSNVFLQKSSIICLNGGHAIGSACKCFNSYVGSQCERLALGKSPICFFVFNMLLPSPLLFDFLFCLNKCLILMLK